MQESLPSFMSIKPPGDANSPPASGAGSLVIPTHNRPDLHRLPFRPRPELPRTASRGKTGGSRETHVIRRAICV